MNKEIAEFSHTVPLEEQVWIGDMPPIKIITIKHQESTGFRAAPHLHTRFRLVWHMEDLLDGESSSWMLDLDETLRLLAEKGLLVIRFKQRRQLSVVALKNFLFRRAGTSASLLHQTVEGAFVTCVFKITRDDIHQYRNRTWSFAVLTQGNKNYIVKQFLASVRNQDPDHRHQIIICGPRSPEFDPYEVDYLEKNYGGLARISEKKNDIVTLARNPNILVCHDRYVLEHNFISGFDLFGYDFDYVAVNQLYQSGSAFPSAPLYRGGLQWSTPIDCHNHNYYEHGRYANGGLFVLKKNSATRLKLNSLLLWNEAEDVELGQWYSQFALPLRTNPHSTATTIGINESYAQFAKLTEINQMKPAWLIKEDLRRIYRNITRTEIEDAVLGDCIWENSNGAVMVSRIRFFIKCTSRIKLRQQPINKLIYRILIASERIIRL